jgi:hypothetical protein
VWWPPSPPLRAHHPRPQTGNDSPPLLTPRRLVLYLPEPLTFRRLRKPAIRTQSRPRHLPGPPSYRASPRLTLPTRGIALRPSRNRDALPPPPGRPLSKSAALIPRLCPADRSRAPLALCPTVGPLRRVKSSSCSPGRLCCAAKQACALVHHAFILRTSRARWALRHFSQRNVLALFAALDRFTRNPAPPLPLLARRPLFPGSSRGPSPSQSGPPSLTAERAAQPAAVPKRSATCSALGLFSRVWG